jgi:hypothetical protein
MSDPITITKEGTKIKLAFDSGLQIKYSVFCFYWETGAEWTALLLATALQNCLADRIEKIRRLEYEAGWSDAKHKKEKRDWFFASLIDRTL